MAGTGDRDIDRVVRAVVAAVRVECDGMVRASVDKYLNENLHHFVKEAINGHLTYEVRSQLGGTIERAIEDRLVISVRLMTTTEADGAADRPD